MLRRFSACLAAAGVLAFTATAHADVFVTDVGANAVRWYDDAGSLKGSLAGNGLDGPTGITLGPDGLLYVPSVNTQQIFRYNPTTGAFVDVFVQPGNGLFDPNGLAFSRDGSLFVANFSYNTILRYDSAGNYMETLAGPSPLNFLPIGIAAGPDGDIFVTASKGSGTYGVYRYDGDTGAAEGWFTDFGNNPTPWHGEFGPDGQLYTPLYLADTIQRTTAEGVSSTFTNFDGGVGLTFLPDGDLLVTSFVDKQVYRIDGQTGDNLGIFASGFTEPVAILHVPEPTTLAIVGAVSLLVASRRRAVGA